MINLLTTASVASWLSDILNRVCLWIDGLIYYFVALIYKVFYLVSKANLFGDSELKVITDRVFVVLGVAMLFVFAYNILILITNPDNIGGKDDKSLSSLAKNMIISIVLLTLLPTIFNYMQRIQNGVIESNVIGNMILGGWTDGDADYSISEAGTNTALTILGAFFHPIVDGEAVDVNWCSRALYEGTQGPDDVCGEYVASYLQAEETSRIRALTSNDVLIGWIYDDKMEYLAILSWIAGYYAIKLFLSFAMDVGVRVARLGLLQLMAPIPVVLRITKPKGGVFDRWYKEVAKEYFGIFVRLAVIFFTMYVITLIPGVISGIFNGGFTSVGGGLVGNGFGIVQILSTAILILGVLQFAKDAPGMIKDLFNMAQFNIKTGIKNKIGENEYAMRGMTGGAAMTRGIFQGSKKGGFGGGVHGAFSGAKQGWKTGGKIKDVSKIGQASREAAANTSENREKWVQRGSSIGQYRDDVSRDGFFKATGSHIGKKAGDIYKDLTGDSAKYYDAKLKGYSEADARRKAVEEAFDDKGAIKRTKRARDQELDAIQAGERDSDFMESYPRVRQEQLVDANGNPVLGADGNAQMREITETLQRARRYTDDAGVEHDYTRESWLKTREDYWTSQLAAERQANIEAILGRGPRDGEFEAFTAKIDSLIKHMDENAHLMSEDNQSLIDAYNDALSKQNLRLGTRDGRIVTSISELGEALKDNSSEATRSTSIEMITRIMGNQFKHAQGKWSQKKYEALKDS